MNRAKLFPPHKFRFRRQTTLDIPPKRLKFYVEVYFEKRDPHFKDQRIGKYERVFSYDNSLIVSFAVIIFPRGTAIHFLETSHNSFTLVSREQLLERIGAFKKEFQLKYEIIVAKEEFDALFNEAISKAQWEPF